MRIEIDTEEIIEKINVKKLIEDDILSDSRFEEIVDDIFENGEMKDIISKKICDIIEEYMDTDKFKIYVVEKFIQDIDYSDLLEDDRILDAVRDFLKDYFRKITEKLDDNI